ncbi:MAG: pyruvate ferredoxin oxidoreductase [Candidatus Lokiarchaeota archaeon]|nr:pyruvate ferredoxin oxidoreductase [Candidatus Lokiarchaeota archaeon]
MKAKLKKSGKEMLPERFAILGGNETCAWGARYARVQVISAYPITPQTTIVETLSDFVDSGDFDCEYVRVESEHSVMAFLVGASYAGTRTFSATSGQGLFYMNEMLHWAAPSRLPIVLGVANRGVAPGWNIWADHQDVIASRDTGWLILFSTNHQEIFDNIIMAYKIAEDPRVYLPIMVCLEGFQLSHLQQPVQFPDQSLVDEFLPEPPKNGWPHIFLDPDRPITHGSLQNPGGKLASPSTMYFEFRELIDKAQENAKVVIEEVADDFAKKFGRHHGGLIQEHECEDAEVAIVCMGNLADQAKYVVDLMRKDGYKVGSIKLRSYKPFPTEKFQEIAERGQIRAFVPMERSMAFSQQGGAASVDLKSALYDCENKPFVLPYVAGVGGRDVTVEDQMNALKNALKVDKNEAKNFGVKFVNFHN